jgi:hypothetical protein
MKPRDTKRRFSPGRWAVERERCRLADPAQPSVGSEPVAAAAVVTALLRKIESAMPDWQSDLAAAWPALAGSPADRHTRPGRLDGNVLVVFVDSPVWLHELSRSTFRRECLQRIEKRFGRGRIASLRLAPDPDGGPRSRGRSRVTSGG